MKSPEEKHDKANMPSQPRSTGGCDFQVAPTDTPPEEPSQGRSLEAAPPGMEAASSGASSTQVREAYLRGRNEAISASLGRDSEHPLTAPRNHTPGIEDPYTPPSDPTLAAIFTFRPSVWQ